jgi:hypothetical protein
MEIAVRFVTAAERRLFLARVWSAPLLAGLVTVSAVFHLVAGWLRATPVYFSDEYMYAELGRSFAESGLPLVRGELAPFPALVYPLLTAPAWLLGEVEPSWRAVQLIGAVAMSLACLPVFVLARRLALDRGVALALAALTIAVPDMVYAGWILAETVAYPLALAAVAAAVLALATSTRRSQLLFLALAALATGTRAQFAVLFLVYPAAVAVLGLTERRLRAVAREQVLALSALSAAVAGAAALGPSRLLGTYRGVLGAELDAGLLAERAGANALVLAYASAWILIPGAVLGFGLALARPRSRLERAFAALAVPMILALLLEASVFATPQHVQERYAFYALPLVGLAFGLYAARGWPLKLAHAGLAAALLCASALAPLSSFTVGDGKTHSAFLLAVARLEEVAGDASGAALIAAGVAGACLLLAIAASSRPGVGTPAALAIALVLSALAAAGATSFDLRNTQRVRAAHLPADSSWIERAADGPVTLLRTPGAVRTESLEQLFWNPSVDRVAVLPGAVRLDGFQADRADVADDGRIAVAGRPVRETLLVENRQSWVELRGARPIASTASYTLWKPTGRTRLSLLLAGRYADGWLAPSGRVTVWPERAGEPIRGSLRVALSAPHAAGELTLTFESAGHRSVRVAIPGGTTREVVLTVCSQAPWRARFRADQAGFVGTRLVSARSSPPAFTPDPGACTAAKVSPTQL